MYNADDRYNSTLNLTGKKSERQQYSGMAFPFGTSVLSVFYPKSDEDVIRSSIENILMTIPGERVMRPTFGVNLYSYLFEPNDDILEYSIRTEVEKQLSAWDDRYVVDRVTVSSDEELVVIRISVIINRPNGPKQVNVGYRFDREKLFSG